MLGRAAETCRCDAQERQMRIFTHLYETKSEAVLARSLAHDAGSMVQALLRVGMLTGSLTFAHWRLDHGAGDRHGRRRWRVARHQSRDQSQIDEWCRAGQSLSAFWRHIWIGMRLIAVASDAQSIFQAMKLYALAWGLQADADDRSAARVRLFPRLHRRRDGDCMSECVGRLRRGSMPILPFIDLTDPSMAR